MLDDVPGPEPAPVPGPAYALGFSSAGTIDFNGRIQRSRRHVVSRATFGTAVKIRVKNDHNMATVIFNLRDVS